MNILLILIMALLCASCVTIALFVLNMLSSRISRSHKIEDDARNDRIIYDHTIDAHHEKLVEILKLYQEGALDHAEFIRVLSEMIKAIHINNRRGSNSISSYDE